MPRKALHTLITLACLASSAGLQATVVCSLNGAVLTFAPYDVLSASPTDSIGSVDLQCTNLHASASSGVTVAVALSAGANGSTQDRRMAGNGSLLRYGIYRDGARTAIWGQGMDAVQQSSGPLASNETKMLHFNLFARIPAQQDVRAGLYQDQLILTITP